MGDDQWFLSFSNSLNWLTTNLSESLNTLYSENWIQAKKEKLKEFVQYFEKGEKAPEKLYTELEEIDRKLENYELLEDFHNLEIPLTSWSPDSYIIKEGEN